MLADDYRSLIGKRLLNNIYDTTGVLLIAKETLLLESHIMKLANFKIRTDEVQAVDIDSSEAPDLAPQPLHPRVKQAEKYLNDINSFVQHSGIVPIAEVEDKVLPYIEETAKRYNLFQVFSALKDKGDYRHQHCIGVAVVATSLGQRLGLSKHEQTLLTTAATLYDIGMVKLPSSILSKSGRLDSQEYAIMKQHTHFGYELLQQSEADPRVALVALQHHEREDGSGYPHGLKGDQIDKLSKIVALADVYVALISERPYRSAVPSFEVIEEIHKQIILNRFDSVIGLTLLDMLLSRQIGCEVLLSNQRKGKILLTNVNYPSRPLVVLDDQEFIDLQKIHNVHIEQIMG
ncbi:HD-GYP domain-containing protein [Paenibacillus tepidiphilus]|uniref:HD-GYP domain-containing protein n=1 Tax=Paenibacillus tepidiphilus TaxID=2608683 RepID=UPI00123891BE|nr:HD-GYP domain-containing protein [Paenibacillus tepidiphilus]